MDKQTEALKLALEALEESLGYVEEEAENAQRLYGQYPTRQARIQGLKDDARKHMNAITAICEALAEQPAQQRPQNCGTGFCSCIECPYEQPAQQQKAVAIKWTLDGDKTCGYNNWLGETPFGRILITWKGWKKYHDACVDEFPGDFNAYGSPNEVKEMCDAEFAKRCGYTSSPAAQQQEPVAWGVDWGRAGDQSCVSIIKRLPDGSIEVLATEYGPPASKPWVGLTDEQITAGARALCKQMAEACGVDVRDQWQLYSDTFKEDAKAVLEAAHGIKGDA